MRRPTRLAHLVLTVMLALVVGCSPSTSSPTLPDGGAAPDGARDATVASDGSAPPPADGGAIDAAQLVDAAHVVDAGAMLDSDVGDAGVGAEDAPAWTDAGPATIVGTLGELQALLGGGTLCHDRVVLASGVHRVADADPNHNLVLTLRVAAGCVLPEITIASQDLAHPSVITGELATGPLAFRDVALAAGPDTTDHAWALTPSAEAALFASAGAPDLYRADPTTIGTCERWGADHDIPRPTGGRRYPESPTLIGSVQVTEGAALGRRVLLPPYSADDFLSTVSARRLPISTSVGCSGVSPVSQPYYAGPGMFRDPITDCAASESLLMHPGSGVAPCTTYLRLDVDTIPFADGTAHSIVPAERFAPAAARSQLDTVRFFPSRSSVEIVATGTVEPRVTLESLAFTQLGHLEVDAGHIASVTWRDVSTELVVDVAAVNNRATPVPFELEGYQCRGGLPWAAYNDDLKGATTTMSASRSAYGSFVGNTGVLASLTEVACLGILGRVDLSVARSSFAETFNAVRVSRYGGRVGDRLAVRDSTFTDVHSEAISSLASIGEQRFERDRFQSVAGAINFLPEVPVAGAPIASIAIEECLIDPQGDAGEGLVVDERPLLDSTTGLAPVVLGAQVDPYFSSRPFRSIVSQHGSGANVGVALVLRHDTFVLRQAASGVIGVLGLGRFDPAHAPGGDRNLFVSAVAVPFLRSMDATSFLTSAQHVTILTDAASVPSTYPLVLQNYGAPTTLTYAGRATFPQLLVEVATPADVLASGGAWPFVTTYDTCEGSDYAGARAYPGGRAAPCP